MTFRLLAGLIALFLVTGCDMRPSATEACTGDCSQASSSQDAAPVLAGQSSGAAQGSVAGIDVSHYQGDVDWAQVKAAGIGFAYAKATQGDDDEDPDFQRNFAAMKSAGLLRGAYDFYVVGDDPDTQAEEYISKVRLVSGDLPPMVDIETESKGVESDPAQIADLHTYLETLQKHYGASPIIYTSPGFWNAYFDDSFTDYPLWVAEYGVSAPRSVTGWTDWTIWQHSQSGKVAGIAGSVDLDRFNGSAAQLDTFRLK